MNSNSNIFIGLTDDISKGGLFLATYDLLPVGQKIELELLLPGDTEPICAQAEVRWHREYFDSQLGEVVGFGAKFIDISEADQTRLDDFVGKRDPLFHSD